MTTNLGQTAQEMINAVDPSGPAAPKEYETEEDRLKGEL